MAGCIRGGWCCPVRAAIEENSPCGPLENGSNEWFNENLGNELLNGEVFYSLEEARLLIEHWRQHCHTGRYT